MAATKTTTNQAVENKATEAKTTKKTTTKKAETKKVDNKKVENKEKVNQTISIEEVEKLYSEAGINIANKGAKGNYRIMGAKKGSSLNLQRRRYIIYSTDTDFEAVEEVKDKYQDLVLVKGGNAQDKSRPNKVEFTALETLKALLGVYAKNPMNKVVATK